MDRACSANRRRQTAILNYEISTVWYTEPRTTPQNTSGPLMRPGQVPVITYVVDIQIQRFVFLDPCLIPPATQTNIVVAVSDSL